MDEVRVCARDVGGDERARGAADYVPRLAASLFRGLQRQMQRVSSE